jgi:hypothetical protein
MQTLPPWNKHNNQCLEEIQVLLFANPFDALCPRNGNCDVRFHLHNIFSVVKSEKQRLAFLPTSLAQVMDLVLSSEFAIWEMPKGLN